jgi:hypothetical protein
MLQMAKDMFRLPPFRLLLSFMTYHMVNTTVATSGAETDYTSGIPRLIPGF